MLNIFFFSCRLNVVCSDRRCKDKKFFSISKKFPDFFLNEMSARALTMEELENVK